MRKKCILILSCLIVVACSSKKATDTKGDLGESEFTPYIEEYDQELSIVLDPASKVETIVSGFDWSEGPLWIDGLGLIFSDIPPNKIFLWTENNGTKLYLSPSGYTSDVVRSGEVGSNGLLLDPENRLILCQHGDRRIARMKADLHTPKPEFETIVDNYQGKKLNSPNDACFNSKGDLYFTDPPYGLEYNVDDPLKELDFQGVYRYDNDGNLTLITNDLTRPNGIALTPNEQALIVANSDPENAIWMKYFLGEDGLIKSKELFYDATSDVGKFAGLPDGLKIDDQGYVYASGPGGIWIFTHAGKVLGKILTGQATSNCAMDSNGDYLYITADMYVMRVKLK